MFSDVWFDGDTPVFWSGKHQKWKFELETDVWGDRSETYDSVKSKGSWCLRRGSETCFAKFPILLSGSESLPLSEGGLAYLANCPSGDVLVIRERDCSEFTTHGLRPNPTVSTNGEKVAWVGRHPEQGPVTYLVDSAPGRQRDPVTRGAGHVALGEPVLGGPKGESLAFLAVDDAEKPRILVVHGEDVLEGGWDWVGTPVFSPDGSRLAYAVNVGDQLDAERVIDFRQRGILSNSQGIGGAEASMPRLSSAFCSNEGTSLGRLVVDGQFACEPFRRVGRRPGTSPEARWPSSPSRPRACM